MASSSSADDHPAPSAGAPAPGASPWAWGQCSLCKVEDVFLTCSPAEGGYEETRCCRACRGVRESAKFLVEFCSTFTHNWQRDV
eukprot:13470115-Alexandrium_andersonii.AAC.1